MSTSKTSVLFTEWNHILWDEVEMDNLRAQSWNHNNNIKYLDLKRQ